MQKYISIDDNQVCNKTVKFQDENSEFWGTVRGYVKVSDMKEYAKEVIDALSEEKLNTTEDFINALVAFFNHFIPDEEKIG